MPDIYTDASRQLQDQFDTRRLADRVGEIVHDVIDDHDRAFIERMDMFFLATSGEDNQPACSYKGGEPGFVRVVSRGSSRRTSRRRVHSRASVSSSHSRGTSRRSMRSHCCVSG